MNYYEKYLKYKAKYLELKGGQNCTSLDIVLKPILESPDSDCKKIENVKKINYNEICNLSKSSEKTLSAISLKSSKQISSVPVVKSELPPPTPVVKSALPSSVPVVKSELPPPAPVVKSELPPAPVVKSELPPAPVVKSEKLPPAPVVKSEQAPIIKPIQEIEIELYNPQLGGESSNIWPLITKTWKDQNKQLGIRDKYKKSKLNFIIDPQNIHNIDAPIFGRGGFTAVYKIKNLDDITDKTEYILRILERSSEDHLMYNEKMIDERERYKEHSYNIYYFGQLKISNKEFTFLKDEYGNITDNYVFSDKKKNYNFDYIITKVYNIPKFSVSNKITNMDNSKKFLFLYNNILMLNKMYLNNEFHADYKIENVGWNNNDIMDIIMIDYDEKTIQKANKLNESFDINVHNNVYSFHFSFTYLPSYIQVGENSIKDSFKPEQFDMYSVGGLMQIIQSLNITFNRVNKKSNQHLIDLPKELQTKNIKLINIYNIGSSLNLDNEDYSLIPSYESMLKILDYIKPYVKLRSD